MRLSSNRPIIALWLITKLILQPQISAADAALTLSVSGPEQRHWALCRQKFQTL